MMPFEFLDAGTGFYTSAALAEFIQYEIDGAAQTDRNELYITPLCLAAVAVDVPGADADVKSHARDAAVVAIRLFTRSADRIGIDGDTFLLLLRRTLAKNVHDTYAPRLAETITEAIQAAGSEARVSTGITSLVEHAARNPGDMIRKALRALEEARKAPGSAVIYDFRVMPLG